MAHLPVIPKCYRVAIRHNRTDSLPDHAVNVLHVLTAATETQDQVFSTMDDRIAGFLPFAPLTSTFTEAGVVVTITPLDGVTPSKDYTTTRVGFSGGSSGDQIPEAAMGITLKTAKRGKSYRGRIFLGPICEPSINNGKINATGVTDAVAAWAGWNNAMIADAHSQTFCVASYRHATAEPVTSFAGHTEARTQRQRLTRLR